VAVASRRLSRATTAATDSILPRVLADAEEQNRRYSRDQFAHVEEGHVIVLDLETLRPVVLDPWPHQIDLTGDWIDLDQLRETGNLVWRNVHEIKSRKLGITWWVAYLYTWAMRWHPARCLALSLKVGEIADSGLTTDSFFGRIRFIVDYTDQDLAEPIGGWPDHLRPRFHFVGGNEPRVIGQSGGFIAGVGAIPYPGRTGIFDSMFLDEFARIPYGAAVQSSISRACPQGRLYNSTVEGEDNEFWRLREARPKGYIFRRDHWSANPPYAANLHIAAKLGEHGEIEQQGKRDCALCLGTLAGEVYKPSDPRAHRFPGKLTSDWYEAAIVDLTDPQVAAELDIDPTAALTARIYPEFSEERHVAAIEIPPVFGLDLEFGFDYGDTTAVLIAQDTPLEWRILAEVEMTDALPEKVAAALRREILAMGYNERDTQHAQTLDWISRGDPAGEARDQGTGRSIVEDYRREGFAISAVPMRLKPSIRSVKRLLGGRPKEMVISQRCPMLIHHLKHYRYEVDRRGNPKPEAKPDKTHGHDHMPDALRYLAAWKFPAPDTVVALDREMRRRNRPLEGGRITSDLGYDERL